MPVNLRVEGRQSYQQGALFREHFLLSMPAMPWIRRLGSKRAGFRYADADDRPIRDRRTLARIDALRVPPAWRDVHIASTPRSAIQAWGFDARGRKQYRYNARAVERRELRKYHRVRQLAKDLPRLRRTLQRDARSSVPRVDALDADTV